MMRIEVIRSDFNIAYVTIKGFSSSRQQIGFISLPIMGADYEYLAKQLDNIMYQIDNETSHRKN
jgi:hypothetical protein